MMLVVFLPPFPAAERNREMPALTIIGVAFFVLAFFPAAPVIVCCLAVCGCSYLVTGGMALTGAGCTSVYPYLGAAMLAITATSAGYWVVRRRRG